MQPQSRPIPSKQTGFTMIQVGIGLIALAAVGTATINIANTYVRDVKANNAAASYNALQVALESYLGDNWRTLIADKPIAGIANPWAPSIAELRKAGYLDRPLASLPDIGALSFAFSKEPAGCDQLAGHCNIAYLIRPGKGFSSESVAAGVMRELGDSGLITDPQNPAIARSWSGRIQIPSPLAEKNAIFVRGIYMSSKQGNFATADGTRPLTGEWNVGNKAITGVDVWQTKLITFSTRVEEGSPCTIPTPGYRFLAMGTNKYLQYCKKTGEGLEGVWTHAGEDVTIHHTIHVNRVPYPSADGGGSDKSKRGGYMGPDGNIHTTQDPASPVDNSREIIGNTREYGDSQTGNETNNNNNNNNNNDNNNDNNSGDAPSHGDIE